MTPPGRLDFTFNFGADGKEAKRQPATGVGHVVFIAPYSGAAKSLTETAVFAAHPLEIGETFRILPSAIPLEPLTPGSEPFLLRFADTESLHPDALLDSVPSLAELWEPLRDLEREPRAPERLAATLARMTSVVPSVDQSTLSTDSEPSGTASTESTSAEATGDLLDRLLGQRPERARQAGTTQAEGVSLAAAQELVQQFAARVLSEQATTSRRSTLDSSSDLQKEAEVELGKRLRRLLRQQAFQRISGAWLATEMVVRSCPNDSLTRFSAVDAGWTELVSEPMKFAALLESGASVVVVDHCFSAERDELCGLVSLVRACHEHRAFLVTGATPSLAGLDDRFLRNPAGTKHDAEAWQTDWSDEQRKSWGELASLREQGAQFALALPRCLVRHPYGKQGDPLEKFEFEELGDHLESDQFVWANGAYLVARALMEQWCGEATQMDGSYEIGGLPVVSVPDANGRRLQPPLEVSLPRSAIDQLLDQGFSIIEARRDSDRARVYV